MATFHKQTQPPTLPLIQLELNNIMSAKLTSQTTSSDQATAEHTTSHLNTLYPEELLEPNRGLNIREFWTVIVRRKKLLGLITALALLTALLLSLFMKPVYRASTTIQIERQSTAVVDVVLEPTGRRSQRDFWQTQIQLLQSRTLARSVIDKLNMESVFTSKPGLLSFLRSAPPLPESNFLKGLTIEPLSNSQLIMIHYESSDPEQASKIVNAIADTYIQSSLERQFKAAESTQDFLQKQKDTVKVRLGESESELDTFARKYQIVELDNNQTTQTRLLEKIADEFVEAEKERIDLEGQYNQLALAAKSPDPSMVLSTPHIQSLKKNLRKLEADYAEKKRRFGSKSKSARRLNKQVEVARGKIRSEAEAYKASINSRYQASKVKEEGLSKRLSSLQRQSLDLRGKIHTYNALKREVSSNQASYKSLLDRMKEVGVAGGLDTNNISIVDKATTPHKKFKPNIKTNLLFGSLMGFLLGLAAIFLREFMDDSIKSVDEIEKITRLPMLGAIPELRGRSDAAVAQQIITEPKSQIAEAIRSLRTSLSFATQKGAPQTLFFTSSEPGEGKTTIAVNLASAYALAGEKVLVIDADLRNPSVHELLKLDNRIGLSNYLSGNNDLQGLIQNTSITNLHALISGPVPPDPVELISGSPMKDLLKDSAENYDRIIMDGAPVLGLADALILSNIADATLMVIHAEETRKGTVITSLKRLKQANGNVIGTLMNQITEIGSGYSYLHYEKEQEKKKSGGMMNMLKSF